MAFSIPPFIFPTYKVAEADFAPPRIPNIGSKVKDLPDDANTRMKQEHDAEVIRVKEEYRINNEQYKSDLARTTSIAVTAATKIDNARFKKAMAITALALAAIGLVGALIATSVTGTLPLLIIAAPFAIGLIPSTYYTVIFSKAVSTLHNQIQAPGLLIRPVLKLPHYIPGNDLDLRQTRLDAQNTLVSCNTLASLAKSRYSQKEITDYALFDRFAKVTNANRPNFYAKAFQLTTIYNNVVKQKQDYEARATNAHGNMQKELNTWKAQRDIHIANQEYQLSRVQQSEDPHAPPPSKGRVAVAEFYNRTARRQINDERATNDQLYATRAVQNQTWLRDTQENIQVAYKEAIDNLEAKFKVLTG